MSCAYDTTNKLLEPPEVAAHTKSGSITPRLKQYCLGDGDGLPNYDSGGVEKGFGIKHCRNIHQLLVNDARKRQ